MIVRLSSSTPNRHAVPARICRTEQQASAPDFDSCQAAQQRGSTRGRVGRWMRGGKVTACAD